MNPAQVVAILMCFGVMLLVLLMFEVGIFRMSCRLAGVSQPGVIRAVGIVLVLLLVPAVTDVLLAAGLTEYYMAAGYPLWEAGIIEIFIALPIHMLICSYLHARMLDITMSDGLSVWFIEKALKAALLIFAGVGVAGLLLLAAIQ